MVVTEGVIVGLMDSDGLDVPVAEDVAVVRRSAWKGKAYQHRSRLL